MITFCCLLSSFLYLHLVSACFNVIIMRDMTILLQPDHNYKLNIINMTLGHKRSNNDSSFKYQR